jgi:hypothetical protein
MAYVNANDFYNRVLQNDLVSLRALRVATVDLAHAKQRATGMRQEITEAVNEIDAAITATEALLKGGAHHP